MFAGGVNRGCRPRVFHALSMGPGGERAYGSIVRDAADATRPGVTLGARRSGGTADAADLNSAARKGVRVRISAPAPRAARGCPSARPALMLELDLRLAWRAAAPGSDVGPRSSASRPSPCRPPIPRSTLVRLDHRARGVRGLRSRHASAQGRGLERDSERPRPVRAATAYRLPRTQRPGPKVAMTGRRRGGSRSAYGYTLQTHPTGASDPRPAQRTMPPMVGWADALTSVGSSPVRRANLGRAPRTAGLRPAPAPPSVVRSGLPPGGSRRVCRGAAGRGPALVSARPSIGLPFDENPAGSADLPTRRRVVRARH